MFRFYLSRVSKYHFAFIYLSTFVGNFKFLIWCLNSPFLLFRNLNAKHANQAFHIDSYDSTSTKSFNLNSLSLLLEVTPKAEKLRRLIIDKAQPAFKTTLPKVVAKMGRSILKKLNVCQQRSVLKALTAQDYFLIKGMPGTGNLLWIFQYVGRVGNGIV